MTQRSYASALALGLATLLLIATSPAEPPEEPPATPPDAPDATDAPDAPDAPEAPAPSLVGRQVWMVNAPEADCAAAEALGLRVTCEPQRPGAARGELVVWCPEISQAAAETLLTHLSLEGITVRTWESQPGEANPEECGQFYEIVLRY
jgi:hypothetical protein